MKIKMKNEINVVYLLRSKKNVNEMISYGIGIYRFLFTSSFVHSISWFNVKAKNKEFLKKK